MRERWVDVLTCATGVILVAAVSLDVAERRAAHAQRIARLAREERISVELEGDKIEVRHWFIEPTIQVKPDDLEGLSIALRQVPLVRADPLVTVCAHSPEQFPVSLGDVLNAGAVATDAGYVRVKIDSPWCGPWW